MIHHPDERARGGQAVDEGLERVLDALARDATAALGDVRRLARIEREKLRIVLERSLVRLLAYSAATVVGAAVCVVGGLRALDGLSGGLAEATGRAWAGDLLAGLLLLGACAALARLAWVVRDKKRLARLKSELEPEP